MVMLFKLVSCSNKHSCNCTTISEQTSWPEHVVLFQPVQREIGADSKGKAYLAASSNQPCRIIIHTQCALSSLQIALRVQRRVCVLFTWHLMFNQESNGDYSLQKCNEYVHTQGWGEVGLQLYEKQGLSLHSYLLINYCIIYYYLPIFAHLCHFQYIRLALL